MEATVINFLISPQKKIEKEGVYKHLEEKLANVIF